MANSNMITIKKTKNAFVTRVAPGTRGEDVILGITCLIHDLSEREKQFQPDFDSEDLLGSIRLCLQHFNESK